MIYVENDFYSNFSSAIESNDERAIQDIIVDKISKVISKDRKELKSLLRKLGVQYPKGVSNEELVIILVRRMRKDSKMRIGIAFLIAKQEGLLAAHEKQSQRNSDNKKETQSEEKPAAADIVANMASSFGIFLNNIDKEQRRFLIEDLTEIVNRKAPQFAYSYMYSDAEGNSQSSGNTNTKKLIKWGLIAIGVAVVGYLIYRHYKNGGFSKKQLGDGGTIDGGNSSITIPNVSVPKAPISADVGSSSAIPE